MKNGNGKIKIRDGKIYFHGTINGKFCRKSTGKSDTKQNIAWAKKQNIIHYLEKLLNEEKANSGMKTDLESFGGRIVDKMKKNVSIKHGKEIESVFNNKILPYFGGFNIEDIKPLEISDWIDTMKGKYSWTRVKFFKNTFSKILDYAMENGIIKNNPANVRSIKDISFEWIPKTEAYTTDEVKLILENAVGWLKVFLELSFKYGFRPGEIMVLKWNDINLDLGIIKLKRVISNDKVIVEYTQEEIDAKGSKINKNHYRTIPLFPSTIELLKIYYQVRPHKEWLFVTKDCKPFIESSSIINYHFKPFLKEINVKYKTLYAMRRSHASIMKYAGEDLDKIQETMGHTKGSLVTEKHYITEDILSAEDRRKDAAKKEKLFNLLVNS